MGRCQRGLRRGGVATGVAADGAGVIIKLIYEMGWPEFDGVSRRKTLQVKNVLTHGFLLTGVMWVISPFCFGCD